jgi:hypothetical protein
MAPASASRSSAVDLDADDRRRRAGGLSTAAAISVTPRRGERRLGEGDAHLPGRAVADVADRVDRLARAAGGDRRCGARRGRPRAGGASRRAAGRGARLANGRPATAATTASTIDGSSARRPRRTARTRAARLRRDDRVAEAVAQARHVRDGRRVRPHVAVHRRRHDDRRARRERGRGDDVAGRPLAIAASQCAVAGATTSASAESAITMWPMRPSGRRSSTSISTGWRDRAANDSGPTNRVATGESSTTTSAPSAVRSRSSSTAL